MAKKKTAGKPVGCDVGILKRALGYFIDYYAGLIFISIPVVFAAGLQKQDDDMISLLSFTGGLFLSLWLYLFLYHTAVYMEGTDTRQTITAFQNCKDQWQGC